jgi:hypothetical protein
MKASPYCKTRACALELVGYYFAHLESRQQGFSELQSLRDVRGKAATPLLHIVVRYLSGKQWNGTHDGIADRVGYNKTARRDPQDAGYYNKGSSSS